MGEAKRKKKYAYILGVFFLEGIWPPFIYGILNL